MCISPQDKSATMRVKNKSTEIRGHTLWLNRSRALCLFLSLSLSLSLILSLSHSRSLSFSPLSLSLSLSSLSFFLSLSPSPSLSLSPSLYLECRKLLGAQASSCAPRVQKECRILRFPQPLSYRWHLTHTHIHTHTL